MNQDLAFAKELAKYTDQWVALKDKRVVAARRIPYQLRALFVGLFGTLLLFTTALSTVDASVWVNGYTRKDGTYVQGHYRSNPDGNPYNNWSFPGNTNPYTGKVAPGNPDTYLQNYYDSPGVTYGSGAGSGAGAPTYGGSALRYVDGGYYYGSTLFCNYGYYERDGSCLIAPANATAYGGTSYSCNVGYYRDGEQCSRLPDHAYELNGSWQCYSGYVQQGDRCVAPENGWLIGSWLYCKSGYVASNGQCITHTEDCRLYFGDHVTGSARLGGGSSCSCEPGYTWNATQTACGQNAVIASGAASSASLGELQKQLNALFASIAALQTQLAALAAQ
jgi:hypothetical protein